MEVFPLNQILFEKEERRGTISLLSQHNIPFSLVPPKRVGKAHRGWQRKEEKRRDRFFSLALGFVLILVSHGTGEKEKEKKTKQKKKRENVAWGGVFF